MRLLLTGATGKVGQAFLPRFLESPRFQGWTAVALCHNRTIDESDRVSVVRGSLNDPGAVEKAMHGATHVLHMAAVKESPALAMDVAVKGMFVLLEAFRAATDADQFILIGGDCAVGHAFQRYDGPITETSPRRAYKGCYALTKVLEEVMLEQYGIQYGLNGCILRAPWIMEKDDFRCALSFGPDQFGGPPWTDFLSVGEVAAYHESGRVPILLDRTGESLKRNFVHVDDLVTAILTALGNPAARQQTFNISMNRPVDYATVAEHLGDAEDLEAVEIPTPLHSNWLDNSKARHVLGWEPEIDEKALIEKAWAYRRDTNDPRIVWYPG
jgi:nucleoside-diphosphate-sugar epimerase